MASKSKAARENQKAYWEKKLDERLSNLKATGAASESITKDSAVRKLRAKIREATSRLKSISEAEKKLEDMAQQRAEKAAAPSKKEKGKKEKESAPSEEMSKRQQKKRKKREEKEEKQEAE